MSPKISWHLICMFAIVAFITHSALPIVATTSTKKSQLEKAKSEIIALHKASLKAHLERNAEFFYKDQIDPAVMVGRGRVSLSSRDQVKERFESYFASTTFSRYEDLIEPTVSVSPDGNMAWLAVQVAVEGEQSIDGKRELFSITWAWLSIFEKRNGKWVMTANSSSSRQ